MNVTPRSFAEATKVRANLGIVEGLWQSSAGPTPPPRATPPLQLHPTFGVSRPMQPVFSTGPHQLPDVKYRLANLLQREPLQGAQRILRIALKDTMQNQRRGTGVGAKCTNYIARLLSCRVSLR